MKKKMLIIVILCAMVVNGIILYIGSNQKYSLFKDVTIQYEMYQKVNSGMSYDDLMKFIDDKKIDYLLKDNKLSIDSMSLDISDKENIKLENSGMIESFKKIDDKSSEANIKVSYKKDGEKIISVDRIIHDGTKIEYNGTNYILINYLSYVIGIIVRSPMLCLLIIVVYNISIFLLKKK